MHVGRQTYKSHDDTMWPVKSFYSPTSEQLHVPPCLRPESIAATNDMPCPAPVSCQSNAETASCLSASRTPALAERSPAPICEVGSGKKRGQKSPVWRKNLQHPLTSHIKGCGHAPALLCFVAERPALEGAHRRTRSRTWRRRETHGCEIQGHRRL